MADWTLSSGSIVKPYRSPWGAFPIRNCPISTGVSTLTIALGDQIGLCTDTTNAERVKRSSDHSTAIVGYAAEAISAGADTITSPAVMLPVWEANPMVEFSGITKGALLNSTIVGTVKPVLYDSSLHIWYINLGTATALDERVVITEMLDAEGDSGGRVAFRHFAQMPHSTSSTDVCLAFYK